MKRLRDHLAEWCRDTKWLMLLRLGRSRLGTHLDLLDKQVWEGCEWKVKTDGTPYLYVGHMYTKPGKFSRWRLTRLSQ